MRKKRKFWKWFHKWPGIVLSFFLLYYGVTGIFMNHRSFFSKLEINRKYLPEVYSYSNWNNAALKGNLIVNKDTVFLFGNIGVWMTDSSFRKYTSFNKGFPDGIDNRKIFDLHRTSKGELFAATLFGLYSFDTTLNKWMKFDLNVEIERFVGIESIGDTIYAINRSYLFKGKSNGINTDFSRIELKPPVNYIKKVSLFETIWQLHSGEIFGLPGKLVVDFLGLITIFLSITGIIYFIFPSWIKNRKKKKKSVKKAVQINRWSLIWHNKTGAWLFILLIILFFSGIFLRPPILIAIARANLSPIKYTHLDQPNPWYDKLRDILYDQRQGIFLLSTSEGMYTMNPVNLKPEKCKVQPPVSVMGINTLEPFSEDDFLVGSFSGLFVWNPSGSRIINYPKGEIYQPVAMGRPIGDFKVTGTIIDAQGNKYMVDYDKGIIPLWHNNKFQSMPDDIIQESKMSFWSVSLEIHTGRFFQNILGDFYILIVPLSGLLSVLLIISGYIVWYKKYKRKK